MGMDIIVIKRLIKFGTGVALIIPIDAVTAAELKPNDIVEAKIHLIEPRIETASNIIAE